MIRATIPLLIAIVAMTTLLPQMAFAHSGDVVQSKWTDAPPEIDGSLESGEWQDATRVMTTTYPNKLDASADFAVMNDQRYLYLMYRVDSPEDYPAKSQNWRMDGLYLDVNHDGVFNEGKDIVIREGDWGGKFGPVNKSPYYGTYSSSNPTGFDRARIAERAVGWTGNGWIYEMKLPFTLDDGHTWGGPDSTLGIGLNFVAWESERYDEFSGNTILINHQQMVLPLDSSNHFTGTLAKHQLSFLTPYPPLFMDAMLSEGPHMASPQISDTVEVQGRADASDNSGLYIGIGVAAAGAAIAGAVVATRRRPPKGRG